MFGRSRRRGWRGALVTVALGVLLAAVWVSPAAAASPVAGVAKGRASFPKTCPVGTSPTLPGNCLLNEGFDPCPSSTGAGCVRLGGGVLGKPVASEFRIAVSPSVTSVGRSLTVSLSSSLPRCTPALTATNTRCWSQISFGDPRQRLEYLPLNYSAVFNPPLVRFPASCQQDLGPMTCTGLVHRSFGPPKILFDHWMIVGAQINIAGGGSAGASGDYLETAVGLTGCGSSARNHGAATAQAGYVADFVGDLSPNGIQIANGHWQATRPATRAADAPRAQAAAACKLPPTLKLAGHGHGGFVQNATVTAFDRLTNARLKLSLAPGDYLTHVSGAAASRSGGRIKITKSLGTLRPGKRVFHIGAQLASLFAGAGHTVNGMNNVGGPRHWSRATPAPAHTGGDELVFSDSPEYLLGAKQRNALKNGKVQVILPTVLASRQVAGNRVEGILYKQTGQSASGDFRVYLNHENRTPVPKLICVVIAQVVIPPAAPGATQLTRKVTGEGEKPGDPVVAGERALANYEAHRRNPTPQTVGLDAQRPAYVQCFGPIVNRGAAGVINAIVDYHSSAPVNVGVVAINKKRAGQFASNPLGYQFADNKHPNGDPSRTYETDGPLHNPGETHVAGTFDYDEVTVNAMVNLDDAQPFGMLLAGDPGRSPGQYRAALDHGRRNNKGNYGVFYHVTITVTGSPGESAEVALNPRGVGKSNGVTNAFAGIADLPSDTATGTIGREIHIPSSGAIKNSREGTVLGSVHGGQSFSFDFMPPGGAVAPDAIVVLPKFVRVQGTLEFSGGSATGTPDPLIVGLG